MLLTVVLVLIVLNSFTLYTLLVQTANAQPYVRGTTLKVVPAVQGLSSPTSMAILDDNNILVLEKEGQRGTQMSHLQSGFISPE
jgi:glucose/arabinose dehydrogenase